MLIFKKSAELGDYLSSQKKLGKTVGFFPTMGALHNGHLSLLNKCKKLSEISVCSIFVNPTQFNNPDDLDKYPRKEGADTLLLEINGCDVLYLPDEKEVYSYEKSDTAELKGMDRLLEGKSRPGHFAGVARVVKIFLETVKPDKAFFGLKDYQQCVVIKNLIEQFKLPVEAVFVETEREDDGLALSSRNARLTPDQRKSATVIYKALLHAKENMGKKNISEIIDECVNIIEASNDHKVDYFEIVEGETLQAFSGQAGKSAVALTAVQVGEVRLIDNLSLGN